MFNNLLLLIIFLLILINVINIPLIDQLLLRLILSTFDLFLHVKELHVNLRLMWLYIKPILFSNLMSINKNGFVLLFSYGVKLAEFNIRSFLGIFFRFNHTMKLRLTWHLEFFLFRLAKFKFIYLIKYNLQSICLFFVQHAHTFTVNQCFWLIKLFCNCHIQLHFFIFF